MKIDKTLSRRYFLQTATNALKSAALIQAMPYVCSARELSGDEILRANLDTRLKKAVALYDREDSYRQDLKAILSLVKENPEMFLNWYSLQVDSKEENENHDIKQATLESLGRELITDCRYFIEIKSDKELGEFLVKAFVPYTKLIKNNTSSRDIIASALYVCDSEMSRHLKEVRKTEFNTSSDTNLGDKLVDEILNLYETCLVGVSTLPTIDGELKRLVFQIPINSDVFGDNQDKENLKKGIVKEDFIKKAHARVIDILSSNFFSLKQNQGDLDGLNSFVENVHADISAPTASKWPLYVLYGVLNKNPEYFESSIKPLIEKAQKTLDPLTDNDLSAISDPTESAIRCFTLFSLLPNLAQAYFFPERFLHPYPKVPDELKIKVDLWAQEQIAKPIFALFLKCLENETVTIKNIGREQLVNDRRWKNLNSLLSRMLFLNPILSKDAVTTIRKKIAKVGTCPDSLMMSYQTLGIVLPVEVKNKLPLASIALIKETIPKISTLHELRGIGIALATSMFELDKDIDKDPNKNKIRVKKETKKVCPPSDGFLLRLIKDEKSSSYTELEKFIETLVHILHDDNDVYKELIPDFSFPEFKEDGSHIEATKLYFKLKHNAFLVLACSASADTTIDPLGRYEDVKYENYKQVIINILEKGFANYTNLDVIGEEIAALFHLYYFVQMVLDEKKHFVQVDREKFTESKMRSLKELFEERVEYPMRYAFLLKLMDKKGDKRLAGDRDSVDRFLKEYKKEIEPEIKKFKLEQAKIALNCVDDILEKKHLGRLLCSEMWFASLEELGIPSITS